MKFIMKFIAEDFHHIKFPANGTKKFWECVAERANEKLEEKQRATPDPRTEEIVELLKRCKEFHGLLCEAVKCGIDDDTTNLTERIEMAIA